MSSRDNKERKLRNNVEVSTEREYRKELMRSGKSHDPKLKNELRQKWEKSAMDVDKNKLHEVWND